MKNVVVITGGGSGIGLAVARIFKGDAVLLCGRTKSKIDAAVAELKKEGVDVHGMACDVSVLEEVKALAEKAQSLGTIRCLVNNAAVLSGSAEDIYKVNVLGTIYPSEIFIPLIPKKGIIINIASQAGHTYPINDGVKKIAENADSDDLLNKALQLSSDSGQAYSISKRIVLEYTKHCCIRFAKKGVRVMSISPGIIDTPMLDSVKENEVIQDMINRIPVGYVGDPIEIAYLVEFLVSDKALYITGTDVIVDGGYFTTFDPNTGAFVAK